MMSILPDAVEGLLTSGTMLASGLAIVGTSALVLRQQTPKQEDGFSYGVMGAVSFIPLFNWTAWVLPALTQPERAPLYLSYAALYATPLLLEGFSIGGYTVAMLLLGVLHVQVERIVATEPQTFLSLQPLRSTLETVAFLSRQATKFAGSLGGIVAQDAQDVASGGSRLRKDFQDRSSLPGSSERMYQDEGRGREWEERPRASANSSQEEMELKEFDRRMMDRAAVQARRRQEEEGQQKGGFKGLPSTRDRRR